MSLNIRQVSYVVNLFNADEAVAYMAEHGVAADVAESIAADVTHFVSRAIAERTGQVPSYLRLAVEVMHQLQSLRDDGELTDACAGVPGVRALLDGDRANVAQMAIICRDVLAWDSESFLRAAEIPHTLESGYGEPSEPLGVACARQLGLEHHDWSIWDT